MKRTTAILLILVLTSSPGLLALSLVNADCCHSMKMEMETGCCSTSPRVEKSQCDMTGMDSSSLVPCGCVHEISSTDEAAVQSKISLQKDLVLLSTIQLNDTPKTNYLDSRNETNLYQTQVPIYKSISSFLI